MTASDANPPAVPRITDAEWKVMNAFWEIGKGTLRDVVEQLSTETDWKPRTVQTLVRRLTEKGALTAEARGREFLYTPAISQQQCQHRESHSFLGRVFNGQLVPFLAGFVEREDLSEHEVTALRQLLDQAAAADDGQAKPDKPEPPADS